MILLTFFVIFCGTLLYQFLISTKKIRDITKNIPGPPLWPVIGNLPLFLRSEISFSHLMQKNWENYGDRFRFIIGNQMLFVTADVKDVEAIVAHTSNKSDLYRLIKDFMGTSIFVVNGDWAKKKRKVLMPSFHTEVLSNYTPVLETAIARLMKKFQKHDSSEVELSELIQRFTLDVLAETAMGIKINAIEQADSEYSKSFRKLISCWDQRWKNILYQSDFVYFNFTHTGKEERKAASIVAKFSRDIVERRRNMIENNEVFVDGKKVSFLDAMLTCEDENGRKMDQIDIDYEIRGMMIAGHDTTYSTLCFFLQSMVDNLDIQEKIYQEQIEVMGQNKERIATTEDIRNMKYLDMAIKETLRIYPIVPTIGRKAIDDIHLDENVTIPKDTNIFINIFNMSRNPAIFPDPMKFEPLRWTSEEMAKRSAYSSIPFSIGARNCIGQAFAMWELKSVISHLTRNYKFFPSSTKRFELEFSLVIKPKGGLYLKLEKRN